ncbi:MAG TPA: thiamine-phosphate kinase [Gemmatimonadales bacterium]|nr:thiamine-phosphate kinase [Gemmatimonadales bacterium]
MTRSPLGPGEEFDRIRAIAAALDVEPAALGDDCALVAPGPGALVVSTDLSVEDVHFRRAWLALGEIGWRAAAGALSDLAGEGAEPLGLLAAVTVPSGAAETDVVEVMRGVGSAGAAVGAQVLGGDLSRGPVWSVAITVLGRATRPVLRAGALPGDHVWVTGRLGAARAALEAWRRGAEPAPAARRAFAHPEPRIGAGRWLAAHGARAMLDLSDGLAGDAGHLAAASAVALELSLERLPVAPDAIVEAERLGQAPAAFAAEGGEDYELLVALPPEFGAADAQAFTRACGLPLTCIGVARDGAGAHFSAGGAPVALRGYDHFRAAVDAVRDAG